MATHYLSASQVARILLLSVSTVRRKGAELGGVKIPGGRYWLFTREAIEEAVK